MSKAHPKSYRAFKKFDESVEDIHLARKYNIDLKISDNLISSFNKSIIAADMDYRIGVKLDE